ARPQSLREMILDVPCLLHETAEGPLRVGAARVKHTVRALRVAGGIESSTQLLSFIDNNSLAFLLGYAYLRAFRELMTAAGMLPRPAFSRGGGSPSAHLPPPC